MNQQEYRQQLRNLSTFELTKLLIDLDKSLARRNDKDNQAQLPITDDWQAREILAELGRRQMKFDYGALSK